MAALEECDSPLDEGASCVGEAPALQTERCHAHQVLSPCGVRAGWHRCQQEHCPPATPSGDIDVLHYSVAMQDKVAWT